MIATLGLPNFPSMHLPSLRRRLMTWFRRHARQLPWRKSRDPYAIWISEVMLQQTQVVTVVPFFQRFLQCFPTLEELARATEHDVLRLWEGLGYYRRARSLLAAARWLKENHHSTLPDAPEVVGKLPGFGRYTTNAVLSQAYDRRLPILEANSQRVLCRLFAIDRNPKDVAVQKELWEHSATLLPHKGTGDFNQALMELGALVCTPSQPKCDRCPLRDHCLARQQGRQEELPLREKSAVIESVEEVAVVVHKGNRVLLVKRPAHGRWAGMWEFPHHPIQYMESLATAANRIFEKLGIQAEVERELLTIRHSVTRFRIRMACLMAKHRVGRIRAVGYAGVKWVLTRELHDYPLSMPQRRLARFILVQTEPEAQAMGLV